MTLDIHKITASIGARVLGLDPADDQPRRLSRVTVAGDVPVSVTGERSRTLVGDASHYAAVPEPSAAA
jgi:taurine dioxygenase